MCQACKSLEPAATGRTGRVAKQERDSWHMKASVMAGSGFGAKGRVIWDLMAPPAGAIKQMWLAATTREGYRRSFPHEQNEDFSMFHSYTPFTATVLSSPSTGIHSLNTTHPNNSQYGRKSRHSLPRTNAADRGKPQRTGRANWTHGR